MFPTVPGGVRARRRKVFPEDVRSVWQAYPLFCFEDTFSFLSFSNT